MFRLRKKRPQSICTEPGERIYVIGDVHGRYDLLMNLLKKILSQLSNEEKIIEEKFTKKVRLIFLGDIIDRGPESLKCLLTIEALTGDDGAEILRGNHEDLMLQTIKGDDHARGMWFNNGGLATINSLNLAPPLDGEDGLDFGERLRDAVPNAIHKMLTEAPTSLRSGDYMFVHAGVRPGIALDRQDDMDLFFIRKKFTNSTDWHGAMIVHGHTIVKEVEFHTNRIAIDTGAFKSGKLSCLVLEDDARHILASDYLPGPQHSRTLDRHNLGGNSV